MSGPITIQKHPLLPTVLILTLSAMLGVILGSVISFVGSVGAVTSTGPFGWWIYGPTVVSAFATGIPLALVATPIWTVLVGRAFADTASGDTGSAARAMQVTLFSDAHAISVVTREMTDLMRIPPVAYIGWFPNEEINAFAMGTNPKNAMVALSRGAVEKLSKEELLAVIAHELGHVACNDMARMTYARGIQDALSWFLIFRGLKNIARWVFTPLSELELLRFSRAREFTADGIAAQVTHPEWMIAALEKIKEETIQPRTRGYATAMLWAGFADWGIFSTHTPLEKRIAALQTLPQTLPRVQPHPDPVPAE